MFNANELKNFNATFLIHKMKKKIKTFKKCMYSAVN